MAIRTEEAKARHREKQRTYLRWKRAIGDNFEGIMRMVAYLQRSTQ